MFNDNIEYSYIIKKTKLNNIDNDISNISKMIEECKIEGLKIAIKKFLGINNKELNILINNNQLQNLMELKRNALKAI